MPRRLLLKKLILPPSGPLLAGLAGLALMLGTAPRTGLALVFLSLASLYLLSAPWFVAALLRTLDVYPHLDPEGPDFPTADAVVILDGGRLVASPERGGNVVGPRTLERLLAGVRLHRRLGTPILVSGYGTLMAGALEQGFGVPVRWTEDGSRTTQENADRSAALLRQDGVRRAYLVTHGWHLRRAVAAFERAGIEVVPVPAGRTDRLRTERGLMGLLPSAGRLYSSFLVLHEWIGIIWYRLRYRQRIVPSPPLP